MLLLNSCTTTKYVYKVPDVTFPSFPRVETVSFALKFPSLYAEKIIEYAKSNNISSCVTVQFSGTKEQVQEFAAFLNKNDIPYDDSSNTVLMPFDTWFSIVDYKIDVDSVKEYMNKMKETTK